MKNKINYIHHREYIHMKCCLTDLYDVILRVEFRDYIKLMKKHPMNHTPGIFQKINFFLHNINLFVYSVDLEVLRKAFDSMRNTYNKLQELNADKKLLDDYALILTGLQKSLIKYGHLD